MVVVIVVTLDLAAAAFPLLTAYMIVKPRVVSEVR